MKRITLILGLFLSLVPAITTADGQKVLNIETNLSALELEVQQNTLDAEALNRAYDSMTDMQDALADCISIHKENLVELKTLMSESDISDQDTTHKSYLELKKTQDKNVDMISKCTFLLYKTYKIKRDINTVLASKDTSYLFQREAPIWKRYQAFYAKKPEINLELAYYFSGIQQLQTKGLFLPWVVVTSFSLVILMLGLFVSRKKKSAPLGIKTWYRYLPWLIFFLIQSLFLVFSFKNILPLPIPSMLILSSFLFVAALLRMLTYFIVLHCIQKKYMERYVANSLNVWVWSSLILGFLVMLGGFLLRGQVLDVSFFIFGRSISLIICLALFFSLLWILLSIEWATKHIPGVFIQWSEVFLLSLLIGIIALDSFGFYKLSVYIIPNTIVSLLLVGLVSLLIWIINYIYAQLSEPRFVLSKTLRALTGVPNNRKFFELTVMRAILVVGLIIRSLRTFMVIWGVPRHYVSNYENFFMEPLSIFGVKIELQDSLHAILLFCGILMFGRAIAGFVVKAFPNDKQRQLRETLVAFVHYLTFIVGVTASLTVAGIDLSRFALVAGALSVGIGFGLKNITSDFLSGLLLLANPSIKPGDYVVIDDDEGTIKSISFLTTTLRTDDNTDVIIPNSYLVSKTVKNHTHYSRSSMISCRIQLVKTEDISVAEKILLDVASQCDGVIAKGRKGPDVELSLEAGIFLTLWCTIDEINKKYQILNQLNHEVIARLAEQNIPIQV